MKKAKMKMMVIIAQEYRQAGRQRREIVNCIIV